MKMEGAETTDIKLEGSMEIKTENITILDE